MVIYAQVPKADASNISSAPVSTTSIAFNAYYDFETGNLFTQTGQNPGTNFDLKFAYNSTTAVGARMFWNEAAANMALVYGKGFDQLNKIDQEAAGKCCHPLWNSFWWLITFSRSSFYG